MSKVAKGVLWAFGLITAGFMAVVANELAGPMAAAITGISLMALEWWAVSRLSALMTQPQASQGSQETQA
jgi:long-subunit fatty acid transport protein